MRLFVGIPLSEEIKFKLKPVYEQLRQTGGNFSFVLLENLHFTLAYLGEVANLNAVVNPLQEINFKPFLADARGLGSFGQPPKIIWVGSPGRELTELARLIREKLKFQIKDNQPYQPHLTLARIKLLKDKNKLKKIISKYADFTFGRMRVNRFILYGSKLTPKGPVYTVIREFKAKISQNQQRLNSFIS